MTFGKELAAVRRNAKKIQDKYIEKGFFLAEVNYELHPVEVKTLPTNPATVSEALAAAAVEPGEGPASAFRLDEVPSVAGLRERVIVLRDPPSDPSLSAVAGPPAVPQKIWKIHFRNVSAPLPHFVETFMDNGYYDMYKIMKALRDVNYDGIVILDHTPNLVAGGGAQIAYGFAYMKALMIRANAEAKR